MKSLAVDVAVVALVLGVTATVQAAPIVRVVGQNGAKTTINIAPNTETSTGNIGFTTSSLAVDPSGILYSADGGGNLYNVSLATPIFAGSTGYSQIGDLDYASGGLWGFSNTNQVLFFYNFGSSSVTYAAAIPSLAFYNITGVAYKPSNGSVFLSGNSGNNADYLFEVASSSTTASLIGSLAQSDSASYISDIDVAPDGTLYAMTWFHRYFYTVNTTTATTTFVSMGPHRDVTGMAFRVVPEPASLVALGVATAMFLRRKR
ncbi:MAG: PEP-CTERM sorting domain-containing protein [Fimbriimonas sp.]